MEYCEYIHADCEYLEICKERIEGICIKDILGEELILKPEYSPNAIKERILYFANKDKMNKELEVKSMSKVVDCGVGCDFNCEGNCPFNTKNESVVAE